MRKQWNKLSEVQPIEKGKYDVLINRGGTHKNDTLHWTTKAMWEDEKVEYWRNR